MKGDRLPARDHIARYCGRKQISDDGQIEPTAFHLRNGEDYLSVRWLEIFQQPDRIAEIKEVRRVLGMALKMGSTAQIAVLNVGEVCSHVQEAAQLSISVLHEPLAKDLSHSGIYDTRQDEALIAELIVETILETHPAVEQA